MTGLVRTVLRTFLRNDRGGASLELALGGVAVVSVAALCFDLYARIDATTASARAACSMADYVSRDTAPDGDAMSALGHFLHAHEIGVPSAMVYVVSAFHQPPGDPLPAARLLWSDDTIRIGDAAVTRQLASACTQFADGGNARLPAEFTMSENETLVIAEVCVRLTREGSLTGRFVAGDIYRLHALPTRDTEQVPAPPAYTRAPDASSFAFLDGARRGAGPVGRWPGAAHGAAPTRRRRGEDVTIRRFLGDARAGATAIAAAAVAAMTVGGTALIGDHIWLVDQRDALKSASDAAGVAATLEMARLVDAQPDIDDDDLEAALERVARRYVELNLAHLPADRLARARSTLVVNVEPDRRRRTVGMQVEADLGGTVLSRHLPMIGESVEPGAMGVRAQVESTVNPIEVVLAIDVSQSMGSNLEGRPPCRGCPPLADSRVAIVKRAAANLVDILEPSADHRIAVGVVPWHYAVRLEPDIAADWSVRRWARYPARRVYGEPYHCYARGGGCTPPAPVEQPLAAAAPEAWNGCLDSHRIGATGSLASLPDDERVLHPAFDPCVRPTLLRRRRRCIVRVSGSSPARGHALAALLPRHEVLPQLLPQRRRQRGDLPRRDA